MAKNIVLPTAQNKEVETSKISSDDKIRILANLVIDRILENQELATVQSSKRE